MHPELAYMSIAPSLATVAGILERAPAQHSLRFEFCVFRNTIVNSEGKPIADIDLIKAQHELETQFRWVDHPPGATVVHQAVQLAADKRRVDPVHEYLRGLEWDTKPRLSNLLTDYFGAEEYDKDLFEIFFALKHTSDDDQVKTFIPYIKLISNCINSGFNLICFFYKYFPADKVTKFCCPAYGICNL